MDTVVQVVRCSFDIHMQDIAGTLIVGATIIMVRPQGIIDLEYISEVLREKQITYIHAVPTLLNSLCNFLNQEPSLSCLKTMRSLCSIG